MSPLSRRSLLGGFAAALIACPGLTAWADENQEKPTASAKPAGLTWVDTSGAAPADAVVIFDGGDTGMLVDAEGNECNWPVEDGVLVCAPGRQKRQQGLWTRLHFRDAQIHAEFMVPDTGRKGGGAGNSGLYIHGLFEQQILDSYDNPTREIETIGAIYGISPPLVNAARKPGTWQTYDIIYTAPRRNDKGEPTEEGSITSLLNGVLVQHNARFSKRKSVYTPLYFRTTPYAEKIRASLLETGCGPLQLQDHDNPVRFRKLWIRPLDDQAFLFAPGEDPPRQKLPEKPAGSTRGKSSRSAAGNAPR